MTLFNATDETQTFTAGSLVGMDVALHPVQAASVDPALAGGVVLTTVTDVIGYMAFLGLGTALLL